MNSYYPHTSWTPGMLDKLRELWGQNLSATEIADAMGLYTRNQVISKARKLGLLSKVRKEFKPRPKIVRKVDFR